MWNRQSWTHIYVPILFGGLIYTLFRVDTLLVFKLYENFHINQFLNNLREVTLLWHIPSFVVISKLYGNAKSLSKWCK